MGCGSSAVAQPQEADKRSRKDILNEVFATIDKDNSGSLNIREYRQIVGKGPSSLHDAVFKRADADHDGQLSKEEFVDYNIEYGKSMSNTEFAFHAKRYVEILSQ